MFLEGSNPSDDRRRQVSAGALSIASHSAVILLLLFAPKGGNRTDERSPAFARFQKTPLIAPPSEFTQKEPNRAPISKEVNVEGLLPRPKLLAPQTPKAVFVPPEPAQTQPQLLPEPPKIEAQPSKTAPLPQQGLFGALPYPPPPKIEPEEKPKLAFETRGAPSGVPKGAGHLTMPSASVDEAVRRLARGRGSGGVFVGDAEGGGIADAIGVTPSPGRSGSALELLSDPMGVDFRPYLIRILSSVRRNWLAVVPESVKLGRRGKVVIQFSISRDGGVPKLVIAAPSGTDALDRAAVAGISASNPFPPLPSEFKGDLIKVQFSFLYNFK